MPPDPAPRLPAAFWVSAASFVAQFLVLFALPVPSLGRQPEPA